MNKTYLKKDDVVEQIQVSNAPDGYNTNYLRFMSDNDTDTDSNIYLSDGETVCVKDAETGPSYSVIKTTMKFDTELLLNIKNVALDITNKSVFVQLLDSEAGELVKVIDTKIAAGTAVTYLELDGETYLKHYVKTGTPTSYTLGGVTVTPTPKTGTITGEVVHSLLAQSVIKDDNGSEYLKVIYDAYENVEGFIGKRPKHSKTT